MAWVGSLIQVLHLVSQILLHLIKERHPTRKRIHTRRSQQIQLLAQLRRTKQGINRVEIGFSSDRHKRVCMGVKYRRARSMLSRCRILIANDLILIATITQTGQGCIYS